MKLFSFLLLSLILHPINGFSQKFPTAHEATETDKAYGKKVASQLSDQYQLDKDSTNKERARRVLDRLVSAADGYSEDWELIVFKAPTVRNAAATKGNYIFIWTGLLNFVKGDSELATIMAHELSHVILGHTQPTPELEYREIFNGILGQAVEIGMMSTGLGGIPGQLAAKAARSLVDGAPTADMLQERELRADEVGLFILAKAGYDPEKSIEFWKRASRSPDFNPETFQFFSSHPGGEERMKNLLKLLPEATIKFKNARKTQNERSTLWIAGPFGATIYDTPEKDKIVKFIKPGSDIEVTELKDGWFVTLSPYAGVVAEEDLEPR